MRIWGQIRGVEGSDLNVSRLQKLSFEIRLQRSIHSLPINVILRIVHHQPYEEEKNLQSD